MLIKEVEMLPDGRMDAQNAAKYLGLSPKTLAMMRCEGTGPIFSKRGRIFYKVQDLDAWLAERSGYPMVDKQASLLNRLLKNYGDIAFKCGLLNHYATDFRKIAEKEQQQLEFCLPDLFFSIFRDLYAEDPDNFIENMRQSLGW